MKMTLPKFYLFFMLVSFGLFTIDDKATSKTTIKKVLENKSSREVQKEDLKEEKTVKRPYRHYYRFSNLC